MNKFMKWINQLEEFEKKNRSGILTGLAIVGVIGTAYEAYKAGLTASNILKEYKEKMKEARNGDERTDVIIGTAKKLVPVVAPVIVSAAVTGGCIIGSHSTSKKKIALLTAAYNVSEKTVRDLNGKMTEILGAKKVKEIKDAIVDDKLKKEPLKDEKEVYITGDGTVLCKDMYSGRYFRSNAQRIENSISQLSQDILSEMYVSLNDLYRLIGLDDVPMGDDFGWNVEDLDHGLLPITLVAHLSEEKRPVLCIDYEVRIRHDYRNLY